MFGFDHPIFRRLWVRIAVVGVAATWGVFEFMMGNAAWAILFLAIAVIGFYGLFIAYKPPPETDEKAE